ncbi:MAG: DnaJ domain-containing protein [Aquaticitalea sp.]
MIFKDYYRILNLKSTATGNEIKRSYRRLAFKFHPDKNFGSKDSEIKFREIKEAYDVLSEINLRANYDHEYDDFYQKEYAETKSHKTQSEPKASPVTPETYLKRFSEIRLFLTTTHSEPLNQQALYNHLNAILNDNSIEFLLESDHFKINRQIIFEVLKCCRYLSFDYVERIAIKLARLAGSDNEAIQKIFAYTKRRKILNYWPKYRGVALVLAIIIFVIVTNYQNQNNSSNSVTTGNSSLNQPQSGNLYRDTPEKNDSSNYLSDNNKQLDSTNHVNYSDWDSTYYQTGNSPGCYNFTPRFNKALDNKLEVTVGYNTDAVVKLINVRTKKCIRYVYIRSGDTYNVKNIPEGKYYLKIAYGKDWRQKIINQKCVGKFILDHLYKKGNDTLDFNKVFEGTKTKGNQSYNSYQIPSFSLKLDVITTDFSDQFKTNEISEEDFND